MSDLTDLYSEMGNKQRDRRVRRTFTDNHGRKFFAWADKDNQRPIGEFQCTTHRPPWTPSMFYIAWLEKDGLDFRWEYEKLAEELAVFTAMYYEEASKLARFLHVDIPKVGEPPVEEVLAICGPPPLSPEIPLACQAGERWLLGYPDAPVNERLNVILQQGRMVTSQMALDTIRARVEAMVAGQSMDAATSLSSAAGATPLIDPATVTYKEFVGAAMRAGQSMADAALAWKAHRENVALESAA
jgi:hypothetical protein